MENSASLGGEVELNLEGMNVCIGIPCYSGVTPIEQTMALVEAVTTLRQKGVKVCIAVQRDNALIDLARNYIVNQFLEETKCNKLFWLDDDIIFKADDMERLLGWSTLYPVVGATYPVRGDPPKFFVRRESDQWKQNEYGLFEIIGTGLGFCVMDRAVFDKMKPTVEKFTIENTEIEAYFTITREKGIYFGEDITFFKKWHEMGGNFMLDPSIELQHVGSKYYDHKFIDYIQGLYAQNNRSDSLRS